MSRVGRSLSDLFLAAWCTAVVCPDNVHTHVRSSYVFRIGLYQISSPAAVDPRAVAVSRYGWLTTSYGWLAGYRRLAAAYGLHLKSADKLLSKVTFETCRRRLKTFFSNC